MRLLLQLNVACLAILLAVLGWYNEWVAVPIVAAVWVVVALATIAIERWWFRPMRGLTYWQYVGDFGYWLTHGGRYLRR